MSRPPVDRGAGGGARLAWVLLPALAPRLGRAGAAVAVGVAWGVWHLPLWFLPAPQRATPFVVFLASLVAFSLLMTLQWQRGGGARGPVVLFHLAANVGVGYLEASYVMSATDAYRRGLPWYAVLAGMALALLVTIARTRSPSAGAGQSLRPVPVNTSPAGCG